MALVTKAPPHRTEETFNDKDRAEIHQIITKLRHDYLQRHTEALAAYHQAEREANKRLHEVERLERHLQRIEVFCKDNDIPFEDAINEGNEVS